MTTAITNLTQQRELISACTSTNSRQRRCEAKNLPRPERRESRDVFQAFCGQFGLSIQGYQTKATKCPLDYLLRCVPLEATRGGKLLAGYAPTL
jgi:hypothetical protein